MKRDDLGDLLAFSAIAEAKSFTRAAAKLGISPSALSHAMRGLEQRLGLRLLSRTTRSVATTEAGERLLQTLVPAFDRIETELGALSGLRDQPGGTIRITTPRHAALSVLWPMIPAFLRTHPNIRVEITIDEALTDIVASRYDAGLRFGEKVDRDMIAVRVGAEIRSRLVASPAYFSAHPMPKTPKDLADHRCINYRLASGGGLYPWEFERGGRSFEVRVDGQIILNDSDLILSAALNGIGIASLFEDQVADHLAAGRLIQVLADWSWSEPGYYLYYPSRRQTLPALTALIDALRAKEPGRRHRRKPKT